MWRLTLAVVSTLVLQGPKVQVRASLDRTSAAVDETVQLTVTVRGPGLETPEIDAPDLEGFEVLGTADRSTLRFSPSGETIREFSRVFTLKVAQPGRLTVPPIRVSVDGVLYETEALDLRAEGPDSEKTLPGELGPLGAEEVALRMWVEPETAYVGQQVTLTVAALFDPLVRSRLQRQPEYRPPDVQSVWTADLPSPVGPERKVIEGREYYVQIFRRALFPLGAGTLRVPPAAVIYEIRRGLIYAPETFQVESPAATVLVRPLPTEGRPGDFTGAVGHYAVETTVDRSSLRVGEAVNLVLDVNGTGNLNSLGRPELPHIPSVRVYDGGEEAEVQVQGTQFAGHKRFSWVLVPEKADRFMIPALRFPYFDPSQAAYAAAVAEPVSVQVETAGPASAGDVADGSTIRYIKVRPGRRVLGIHRTAAFWLVIALPGLVLLGLFLWGGYRRVAATPRPDGGGRMLRRRLRELQDLAESRDGAFFGRLRATIIEWLADRFGAPDLASGGVLRIQHVLEDAGVPPDVALNVIKVVEDCGRLRYAPRPPRPQEAHELLKRAEQLLSRIDREGATAPRLRAPAGDVSALLLVMFVGATWSAATAVAGPPPPAAQQDGPFAAAVSAYARGEYAPAARLFEQALAKRPGDPSILYDLGNAYYKLDRRGRAVAYWVRSLRVDPRDGDARHNLRFVVGDDPVIASALPPVPLSSDELALLVAVLWLVGCAALIGRWRQGLRHLTVVGAAALALAAGCAWALWMPRPGYAVMTSAEVAIRAGPVDRSEVVASSVPGTVYRIREERGEWLRVERGRDREGWVRRRGVEVIQ